jgi:hypothetical protein
MDQARAQPAQGDESGLRRIQDVQGTSRPSAGPIKLTGTEDSAGSSPAHRDEHRATDRTDSEQRCAIINEESVGPPAHTKASTGRPDLTESEQ